MTTLPRGTFLFKYVFAARKKKEEERVTYVSIMLGKKNRESILEK